MSLVDRLSRWTDTFSRSVHRHTLYSDRWHSTIDRIHRHLDGYQGQTDPFHKHHSDSESCGCTVRFEEPAGTGVGQRVILQVDATDCDGGGDLEIHPACRATVIGSLAQRAVDVIVTRNGWLERRYRPCATELLRAAGRFHEWVSQHDDRLAAVTARDPLAAAHEAMGRAGPVARMAEDTGLATVGDRFDSYADALRSVDGVVLTLASFDTADPSIPGPTERIELDTGAIIRLYERDDGLPLYHLLPPSLQLNPAHTRLLVSARDRLRNGSHETHSYSASQAVAEVVDTRNRRTRHGTAVDSPNDRSPGAESCPSDAPTPSKPIPTDRLVSLLEKHTAGNGVFQDFFADPDVSDVFVSAPVEENPLRLLRDGRRYVTNVHIPPTAAATLASRLRRSSGRAFSRADPTLDASLEIGNDVVRVAATTSPVTDGLAFAYRRRDPTPWTLPKLVRLGSIPPLAAGLLSIAIERGAALLVAGGRGSGKTTLLGALLWELNPAIRTIIIEDTPELPIDRLQESGRDVQRLHATDGADDEASVSGGTGGISPTAAVRTALRLGDGALVVGEVRGREAKALYEAMRVGAQCEAILGTIHGTGADGVRERVVSDLGVSPSSFGATDAVVTLNNQHQLVSIEEIRGQGSDIHSTALFDRSGTAPDRDGDSLSATEIIDQGNSQLLSSLQRPGETAATIREAIESRGNLIKRLASTDRDRPADVDTAVHRRTAASQGGDGSP